jgi:hypothetical protein
LQDRPPQPSGEIKYAKLLDASWFCRESIESAQETFAYVNRADPVF